ncbi:MAG: glycosyltransferase [Enterococcus lacertideformus]|uniref:Glycosyltransferase n=1 Tax=Enterococcus lacertideformus TaxID=2771493 RepID=A0A931F7Y6_9ENTE|nr:glycosyltransferase [Enterococcus lacertideformus]
MRPLYVAPYFEEKRGFDVIIGHYGYNLLLLEIIKNSYQTFPKLVGFFHGNDLTGFVQRFGRKIYQPLQQKTTTMGLPISQLLAECLKEMQLLVGQTTVHHMGIDISDFYYTQPIEIAGIIQLLIVGRLTEKKGIDNAIEAVAILKQKNKKVRLQIIGDGEQKEELQQLIADFQFNGRNPIERMANTRRSQRSCTRSRYYFIAK